jgi:hypothetical protein
MAPLPPTFASTVAALHRVAEQIVAPARKPDNEIALTATPGGFGTPVFEFDGVEQQVRVDGTDLVYERRIPLRSLETARHLVATLVPESLSAEALAVDPEAAARLADWYALGAAVLGEFADATATLWPEHFDIAIDLDQVNYGFSPGDEHHAEPYAYVGPWSAEVSGELWNATGFRGAELSYSDLYAAADPHAAALEFFTTRREALA